MECLKIILLSIVSMNLLASLVSGNTNLNYGIKTMAMAPSTGRAFEYDSFPTNFDKSSDQHTKGFGVPRIIGVPSSAPISQTQIVVPVDRPEIAIKKQEVSKSKATKTDIDDDIVIDDKQNEDKKQEEEAQPLSLYSAMKLIGQKVMQQYPNGHNTDLDQGRIIKGFGFGGGGLKIGK